MWYNFVRNHNHINLHNVILITLRNTVGQLVLNICFKFKWVMPFISGIILAAVSGNHTTNSK